MRKEQIFLILKPYKKQLGQLMLLELLRGICAAVFAWNAAHILQLVLLSHTGLYEAAPYLKVLLFALCLRSLLHYPAAAIADKISLAIRENVRLHLHEAILASTPITEADYASGTILTLVLETTDGLDDFFGHFLPQLLEAVVLLPLFFSIALGVDLWTALIFLVTLPIAPFLLYLIGRITRRSNERQWQQLTALSQGFTELLRGMSTLKIFGRSQAQLNWVNTLSQRFSDASLHVLRLAFISAFVLELITTLSIALIAVSIGLRLLNDTIAFEAAFFALLLAPEFYRPLRQSGTAFHAGINASTAAQRLVTFLAGMPAKSAAGTVVKTMLPPAILFDKVRYRYPGTKADILQDLSFSVPAGSFVVLTGNSGSGKSTILRLLAGLDVPTAGEIRINGLPLQKIEPHRWREIAAYVPQEPHLFRASLRDNVTLFAAEADDKAVSAALQKAALSELLTDEKSLDRMLGDGNASLSSGQLRRLGLARALYRDTPVLLLDEITAGLDEKNEHQVLSTIVAHCYNHTILLATHRSAAQELTDQILLLDAGRAWSYTPAGEDEPKGGLSS